MINLGRQLSSCATAAHLSRQLGASSVLSLAHQHVHVHTLLPHIHAATHTPRTLFLAREEMRRNLTRHSTWKFARMSSLIPYKVDSSGVFCRRHPVKSRMHKSRPCYWIREPKEPRRSLPSAVACAWKSFARSSWPSQACLPTASSECWLISNSLGCGDVIDLTFS